ncbi:MAG: sigma-54-dependent Fis family transcriptional regulator [Planctomycetes bacterium]|nr:sigma-54-dependent Fis family transcriptional regulator [Planctomycetota bacterium]
MTWSGLPWLQTEGAGLALQLCDRLLQSVASTPTSAEFLAHQLPDIASEFSVQWIGVVDREADWTIRAEFGRHQLGEMPLRLFNEALDREAAGLDKIDGSDGWSVAAVPLVAGAGRQTLLAFAGRRIDSSDLAGITAAGRAFAYSLSLSERLERHSRQNNRLRETLRVSSRLSEIHETVPLLETICEEACRLLDCDRASIFVWDKPNRKLLACPALGVEGGTLYIPDNAGIVGSVVRTGTTIHVPDAYADDRFNQQVDKKTGYRTRNLLCVPLLDGDQSLIGAFEGINKNDGSFDADDEDILTQLGIQAAIALRNTRERELLIRTHRQLTEKLASASKIIGISPAIEALRKTIDRLAEAELPVLILGESGTGKEVVSQALHFRGPRADHPFVAVNCAALTESLLESELFGHEKGAFTDAREQHKGKFELADGGTVFLDEIGDMSPSGQAKLLRVLEDRIITRVGGTTTIPVNVRILAATNVNLAEAVREKRFREDLYYRLCVVTIDLPALRDRPEDILPLAEFFLDGFCRDANRPSLSISDEAKRRLNAHGWPGNVRELRNLMERVAFLSAGDTVEPDDLAFILSPRAESEIDIGVDLGLTLATNKFQEEYIQRAAKRAGGNMSEAARMLGLHRSNLYRKMRQLGMDVPD